MSGLDCRNTEKGQKFSLEATLCVVKIFVDFHSVQYPFACSFLRLKTQSVQFVFSPFLCPLFTVLREFPLLQCHRPVLICSSGAAEAGWKVHLSGVIFRQPVRKSGRRVPKSQILY